jgi:hypothetical protein
VLVGEVGGAAEGTATWRRRQVQRREIVDPLIGDELRQVVEEVDLLGLKALAGELRTSAMRDTEQFEAGLECPVRIGCQRQLRLRLEHHQDRAVALAADLDMRVAGGNDAAATAEARRPPRPRQVIVVRQAFRHAASYRVGTFQPGDTSAS